MDRPSPPGSAPRPAAGTDRTERERELAAIQAIQTDLADVDRALDRLDEGSYGSCEVCGEAIADDVLARAPATRLCAAHPSPGPG